MPHPSTDVRYTDRIETPPGSQAEAIAGIVAAMPHESRTVAEREHYTIRRRLAR